MRAAEEESMSKLSQTKLKENLIALRTGRGWSQSELSRRSKVGQSTISRIENGNLRGNDWDTVTALARALGVDPTELAGEEHIAIGEPEIQAGVVAVGSLLPAYIASEWYMRDEPTPDELRWLATYGKITWTGQPATAGTVHVLLLERRKGNL